MADIRQQHATPVGPVEGDGINYKGILWFMVILFVTTIVCQALMWGTLKYLISDANATDAPRSAMAAPLTETGITDQNMVVPAGDMPPPYLQTREPLGLGRFRAGEDTILSTYGWIDKNDGVVRIPIDRAKDLLLERGIPGGKPMLAMTGSASGVTPAAGTVPAQPAAAKPVAAKPVTKIKKD